MHDKKIADNSQVTLPENSALLQDTAYQSYTIDGVTILEPTKKSKKKPLSIFMKVVNCMISRSRVYIEHVIGSVKRCRAVGEKARLQGAERRDLLMEVCCGLHNLRLAHDPWQMMPDPGDLKVI
jgi:hypothetical protein